LGKETVSVFGASARTVTSTVSNPIATIASAARSVFFIADPSRHSPDAF
jgi:hypothetical protein